MTTNYLENITEEDIRKRYNKEKDKERKQKLLSVWLQIQGFSTIEIARFLKERTITVKEWLDLWNELGFESLSKKTNSYPNGRSIFPTQRRSLEELQENTTPPPATPIKKKTLPLLAQVCQNDERTSRHPLLAKIRGKSIQDKRLDILAWMCGWECPDDWENGKDKENDILSKICEWSATTLI